MIDFSRGQELPTRAAVERLVDWTAPAREELGVDVSLPDRNGSQRAREALAEGAPIAEIYREAIEETRRTYAREPAKAT